jgi:hypothetical protein
MTADNAAFIDYSIADRRRYKRERVDLAGRQFEPAEGREAQCKIADMSPGGARVLSDVVPPAGTPLVLYIDGFGRFEGSVACPEQGGFGVQFNCSAHKRDRVAEHLTHYMNGSPPDVSRFRLHDRTPTNGTACFTRASGEVANCAVLDLSISGVSLATQTRPPLGELVLVGQMAGRVSRHHETGIGIEFMSLDQPIAEPARARLFASH